MYIMSQPNTSSEIPDDVVQGFEGITLDTPLSGILENGRYIKEHLMFPDQSVLPPIFRVKAVDYMGNIDKPSDSQQRVNNSLKGDKAERKVHAAFSSCCVNTIAGSKFLALNTFKITRNKIEVIVKEFSEKPDAMQNFTRKYFSGGLKDCKEYEQDLIVAVENVGIVIVEVKSNLPVGKGYQQLNRSEVLMKDLIKLIFPDGMNVPVLKVVALPLTRRSKFGKLKPMLHLSKEDFEIETLDLEQKLSSALNKERLKCNSSRESNSKYFCQLTELLIGIWCLNADDSNSPIFNKELASVGYWVKTIDRELRDAHLSERSKTEKASKPHNPEYIKFVEKSIRKMFDIQYLTKQQEELLYNDENNHVMLDGAAGTGKTICMLMKIVLILKKFPEAKITFITTAWQFSKCVNMLKSCNVVTDVFTHKADISEVNNSSANVVVITFDFKGIFPLVKNLLLQLPLVNHVFIDEFQLIQSSVSKGDNLPSIVAGCKQYSTFWVSYDIIQHSFMYLDAPTGTRFYAGNSLDKVCDGMKAVREEFKDHVYILSDAFRHTVELFNMLQIFRNEVYEQYSGIDNPVVPIIGHNIHGLVPAIANFPEKEYFEKRPFQAYAIQCIIGAITSLKKYQKFKFQDIAVLYDHVYESEFGEYLKCNNIPFQTILEHSADPTSEKVVFDMINNSFSFEWPVVFFICNNLNLDDVGLAKIVKDKYAALYLACSRARVLLFLLLGSTDLNSSVMKKLDKVAYVKNIDSQEHLFIKNRYLLT